MRPVWVQWTMRKSGDDTRRASGVNFHNSKWHVAVTGTSDDQSTIVTACGLTCAPHSTPVETHQRYGYGDRMLDEMPTAGDVCARCRATWLLVNERSITDALWYYFALWRDEVDALHDPDRTKIARARAATRQYSRLAANLFGRERWFALRSQLTVLA